MFGTEEGQKQFIEWVNTDSKMNATEKKSVLEKLKDFISDIITKLKNYINKSNFNDSEKAVANMDIKKATELRNKVLEALDVAIQNVENGDVENSGNINFSIKEIIGEKSNYGMGVYLDTNIFDGLDSKKRKQVFTDFVFNELAGSQIVAYDENNNINIIQFAESNERVKKQGTKNTNKVIKKLSIKKR